MKHGSVPYGNVATVANNRNTNRDQSFTYDELNRVKTAQSAAASGGDCWGLQFGYDIWANLLSATTTKCAPPNLNVTVSTKNQINNANFQYDAAGNLTFDGSLSATYDAENRITSTNGGVSYTYDGDGRRVKKSNGKLYWYGTDSDPSEETDLSGTPAADYIFFNGKRTARLDLPGASVHYYFANHLGSANVVTSSTGTIQDESDYYPFGGERTVTDTDPNQYKFTGKERDLESGLDFFIARYYSSSYGRFLSPDEFAGGPVDVFSSNDPAPPGPPPYADITNPQSLNKYDYTYNNPLRYTDPNGHDVLDFLLGVANAVGSNTFLGAGRTESYNSDHATGQAVGDAISVVVGAAEVVVGGAVAGGGLALDATGVGAVAGVPANVVGAAIAAHGVANAASGIIHLAKDTPNPFGSEGKPDHKAKVNELADKAKGQAKPGETVESNKQVKGHASNRRPDV